MAFPTITLEVAFTTNPGATPSWTDISAYLEGAMAIHRGRSQESEAFRAGTLELTLQNEDRRFDPSYTSSPYYPNVVPMRRVRARAVYSAVTYDLFNGYVDGWDQLYEHPGVAHCRLTATDALKVLANVELAASAYAAEVLADSPAAWYRLGEPVGSARFLDSVGTLHLDITASAPTLGVPGMVTNDPDTAVDFSGGTHQGATRGPGLPSVTGAPFTFEMIFRAPSPSGASLYGEVNDVGGLKGWAVELDGSWHPKITVITATASGSVTTTSDITDGNPHHVAFTWTAGGTLTAYFDGVAQATAAVVAGTFPSPSYAVLSGAIIPVSGGTSAGGTYDEVAVYPTALSAARIAAHSSARAAPWNGDLSGARVGRILDAAGWPAADRLIDTGVAVLQSAELGGTALAALRKVEETERGRLFVTAAGLVRFISREMLIQAPYTTSQATFGDSGAELEYADLRYRYDDSTIANDIVVSRLNGTTQRATDATSVAAYLRRSKVINGLLHQSDVTSADLANWELAHYKDPLLRATEVRLEPDAGNDTTHYPQALGRELSDRVTVRRRPQSVGSAIDQDAWVESINHQATALGWKTDWNLSPADAAATAGIWDTGLWDSAKWGF